MTYTEILAHARDCPSTFLGKWLSLTVVELTFMYGDAKAWEFYEEVVILSAADEPVWVMAGKARAYLDKLFRDMASGDEWKIPREGG